MSLNTVALQPVKVDPAPLDVSPKPYAVDTGYANRTFRQFAPSGSSGDYSSGVNWSISVPSGVGVSRRAYISATFDMTFTFANTGQAAAAAFVSDSYAPRSYPLNRSIATQTATLDGVRFTQNNGQIMDVIVHCLDDEVHKANCLDSVFRRDNCPSYSMMDQATNNPLTSYADGTYQSPSRGTGYYQLNSLDNTAIPTGGANTTRKVSFTVSEAVLVPPFHYESKEEQPALFGIETLEINVNFGQLTRTLWSQFGLPTDITGSITSVAVEQPRLLLEMLTPKVGFSLPKQVVYDIFEMTQYVQAGGAVSAGGTATLTNNNNKMSNSVPSRIFVFARRGPNSLTMEQGNTFLGIQSLSVQMNNRSGLLADATPQQLWDLSRTNGLEQEYEEWVMRKFGNTVLSGGIICLDPAKDLSLDVDQTNGSSGSVEISITAQVQNNDVVDYANVELVIVGLYEGVLNLLDGTKFTYEQGVISKADVLSAQKLPTVFESQLSGLHGGNRRHIGRKIREGLKKAGHWLQDGGAKKIMDGVKTAAQIAQQAEQVAGMMGMGITGAGKAKAKRGRGATGGGLTGGKSLSRNQLLAIMNS